MAQLQAVPRPALVSCPQNRKAFGLAECPLFPSGQQNPGPCRCLRITKKEARGLLYAGEGLASCGRDVHRFLSHASTVTYPAVHQCCCRSPEACRLPAVGACGRDHRSPLLLSSPSAPQPVSRGKAEPWAPLSRGHTAPVCCCQRRARLRPPARPPWWERVIG